MCAPTEFHRLLDSAPDAMVVLDRRGHVMTLNRTAEEYLGWNEDELLGEPMSRFIPARSQRLLHAGDTPDGESPGLPASGGTLNCYALRRDGGEFPVELAWRPLGDGLDAQSLVTLRDLTRWRRTRDKRAKQDEEAHATLASIGDAVITTDAMGLVTYLNPVAERLTGWATDAAFGQSLDAVLPLIAEATRERIANRATRCMEEGRSIDLEEGVLLVRRDGTEVPVGDSAAPVVDRHGGILGVVLVIQDESEKRRVGHRLSYEATHDALTGLVNRREFERRVSRVIAALERNASEHVLICLDLDRFKCVNDSCGHDAGDTLLRNLGPLLSSHLRTCDTLARLGGDEFGVLLENCAQGMGEIVAEELRAEIEHYRFGVGSTSFSIGASIGVIPLTKAGIDLVEVFKAADVACYTAKHAGGNRVHLAGLAQPIRRLATPERDPAHRRRPEGPRSAQRPPLQAGR